MTRVLGFLLVRFSALGLLFVLVLIGPPSLVAPAQLAAAATLVVAKDGSGDFPAIQPAITAAAPGDTIYIKNGIYDDHEPFFSRFGVWDTYVAIKKSPLTFIGESREGVLVGPESAAFDGYDPKGFASDVLVDLVIESLTVRNVREGLNSAGNIHLSNVNMCGCAIAAVALASPTFVMEQSRVSNCEIGVLAAGGSSNVDIRSCVFDSVETGIDVINTRNATIADCQFNTVSTAVQVEQFSIASITNITAADIETVGLNVSLGSTATATNCTFGPSEFGIAVETSKLVLTNSKIEAGSTYTFLLSAADSLVVSNCDILVDPSNPKGIWLQPGTYTGSPPPVLDMRDNYWALQDSTAIENVIWDTVDEPTTNAKVLFMPFRTESTPVERMGIGRLKIRY